MAATGARRISALPPLFAPRPVASRWRGFAPPDPSEFAPNMKIVAQLFLLVVGTAFLTSRARATGTNGSSEIVLGMSTALTGPAAKLGETVRDGVLAGLERANRAGGVGGRHLRLLVLDDGYEPARTAPNMRQLLERDHVLAVVGNVGTPTAVAAIPIANEQKTLFFAPYTGAGSIRKNPPDRYVINYRASYEEEIRAVFTTLLSQGGLQLEDIALFTQKDAYGDAGYAACIAALRPHGLKEERQLLHVRYDRNTLAVEDALASLLFAPRQPRVVVMVGSYAPCAKFIKLADAAGFKPVFHNLSFVGSESLAKELGPLASKVLVTQVVPDPFDTTLPIVCEYRADLQMSASGTSPSFASLEGYLAARILIAALERLPGPPTREGMVTALEALGEFDLGLGEPLELARLNHQACHHVWLTRLQDGAFAPLPWSELGRLLRQETRL